MMRCIVKTGSAPVSHRFDHGISRIIGSDPWRQNIFTLSDGNTIWTLPRSVPQWFER